MRPDFQLGNVAADAVADGIGSRGSPPARGNIGPRATPGKRQHYVPRFLVRRFAIDPWDRKSLIWRLDKHAGRPQRVNLVNELVVGHYYRIVLEEGTVIDAADEAFDRIEHLVAEVVPKLADPAYMANTDDVHRLMLFVASLKTRTPQAREGLREADERMAEVELQDARKDWIVRQLGSRFHILDSFTLGSIPE